MGRHRQRICVFTSLMVIPAIVYFIVSIGHFEASFTYSKFYRGDLLSLHINGKTVANTTSESTAAFASTSTFHVSVSQSKPADITDTIFSKTRNLTLQSQTEFANCAGRIILNSSKLFLSGLPRTYEKCHQMSFQQSGPVVALVSYAGSGNSWVRQLLELATGIYTGAIYCDKTYVYAGMIGEGIRTGNVFAVKTHTKKSEIISTLKPSKVIYIVRNPFESMLAEWCRRLNPYGKQKSHNIECIQINGMYRYWL